MTQKAFTPETNMLIDGKLVPAQTGAEFENLNPATEEVLGVVADAGQEDMRRAIAAARRAFDETTWGTAHAFRKHCLEQLQAAIVSEAEELREELIAEVGTPRAITLLAQLDLPLREALLWPAKMIEDFTWERDMGLGEPFGIPSHRAVWKEPVGVVGAITPWNFPFEVTLNKIGQILATGNTMVLKPAPETPWNATRLGRLVAEQTDIPPGVFNVVTSFDHLMGEELTLSPQVDMISFTGSTATGKRIMSKGAESMKRVFLELGGKSAAIVLDDADFEKVIPERAAVCAHAGQGCVIETRVLVPRARYDEAVGLLAHAVESFPYGDPNDPDNLMGPLVSEKQLHRVLGYIEKGRAEGAEVVVGGRRPESQPKGWFVEPTLLANVDNSMVVARDEIFGPVLVVIPYGDEEEAIRIANDSHYGLGCGVYSSSSKRAISVAQRIRAGAIGVNGGSWYGAEMPFGGYKSSGVGRQNGLEGFEQYLETKVVAWTESE